MITNHQDINSIPARYYEGYIWMSDSKTPLILSGAELFSFSHPAGNPFVIEALLYSRADNVSVMVRHTGKYLIYEYDLSRCPDGSVLENKTFLPHRLEGIKKLSFKQLWVPEKDEDCLDLEVLTLKATIFSGFIN